MKLADSVLVQELEGRTLRDVTVTPVQSGWTVDVVWESRPPEGRTYGDTKTIRYACTTFADLVGAMRTTFGLNAAIRE